MTPAPPSVERVRVDRDSRPSMVSTPQPTLSWTTTTEWPGWYQLRAWLRSTSAGGTLEAVITGPESVDVAWPFPPLEPRQSTSISVRVEGPDGISEWSTPTTVTAAFLGDGEWRAAFLGGGSAPFRAQASLTTREGLQRATLYATALGVFAAQLNGHPVSADVLAPGWTAYRHRLTHETWDVTELLEPGDNALALTVAGGWYTESYGFGENHGSYYGDRAAVAAQLLLEYADGTQDWVMTGSDWNVSSEGPLISSGIYAGEEFDARLGWSGWHPARIVDEQRVPEARTGPVARREAEVAVVEVLHTPSGATVLDFGQNLVGRVRLVSRGAAGDAITLRHAEVLEHGELSLRPLRRAAALDRYVHGGDGPETWEADFTFHGFRYVQVDGVDDLRPEEYSAIVLQSRMRRTGFFRSSDRLLNRLHENVVWSMRGNMLALPTDCPQRDERLGWTGDVQVFAPTAAFLYDCSGFLASWLTDLSAEQAAMGGIVPVVVPWVLDWEPTEVAAWGDAATVVPTVLFERFGDHSLLARQYPSMTAWADRLIARAGDDLLIEGGFQFGDWLDPTAPPEHPERAATHPDFVASAWFIRSLDLVVRAAEVLDRDASRYAVAAASARAAFAERHLVSPGRLSSDAPTAYSLAIAFALVPDSALPALGERLAELVAEAHFTIATGFVGTPLILDALTTTGHADTAVELLLQRECPSWLYPVTMGATTVWERWDSMRPDGSINPGEMTSFNHYALGAVADWMHRRLAGLAPAEPGYRSLHIAPVVTDRLDYAHAELDTPYGVASAGWRRVEGGTVVVECRIPANTRATVELPNGSRYTVESGDHSWSM